MELDYKEGNPPTAGMYLAYVDDQFQTTFAARILLLWHGRQWNYPMSDARYRGHVYGWIGPLPVMRFADDEESEAQGYKRVRLDRGQSTVDKGKR